MTKTDGQKITIDGTEYLLDSLSDEAKTQLANIRFVDAQIEQLNNEWAVSDTARIGYTNALKSQIKAKWSDIPPVSEKITIDGKEYALDDLSDKAKAQISSMRYTESRINELNNINSLLQRAKNSYIEGLKLELISDKSGFLFDDDD